MLEVRGLSVSYGQHVALRDAGVTVGRGEIVVILGANGAGKSSLLKAISGICEGRVIGSVKLQGEELLGLPPNRIVEAGIALVPEGRGIFPDLTVAENLTLGAYSPRARDEEQGNLARVLALFPKLAERRRQVARTMSGGEQQMVAIGRAMMSAPEVLTLDEPSLGLSPLLCRDLFHSLRTVRQAGIGILLVEQNARQSLAIADRGYLIENGRIVHQAPAAELRDDPAVQKAYLGGASAPATRRAATEKPRPPQPVPEAPPPRLPHPRPPPDLPPARGPSPAEIAAAAIASVARRPAPAAAPAVAHPAPPPEPARAAPAPAPVPRPAAPPRPGASPHGIAIDALVAHAAATSAQRVSPRGPAPRAPLAPARTATLGAPKMPDLADSRDRLAAALREIEEAAARARAYRPNRNP